MEWASMEPLGATFILGDFDGDTYSAADDCEDVLEEMLENLVNDDPKTGPFRRRLRMEKVLEKDLIPLLKSTSDEKIFGLAIRFMANLTHPLGGSHAPPPPANAGNNSNNNNNGGGGHNNASNNNNHHISASLTREMDSLLTDVIHLCTDVNFFKMFGSNVKHLLKKSILDVVDRQCLNHCVLFLRNLLHMRQGATSDDQTFIAHQCLLSSFFMNELDKVVVGMLQHKDMECWTIGIAQLISFIFKDYSAGLLEPDLDDNTSNSSGEENQNMVEILLTEGGTPNNHQYPHHATSTGVSTTRTLTNNFKKNLQISSGGGSACSMPMDGDDFMLEIKSTQDGRLEIKLASPTSLTPPEARGDNNSGGSGGSGSRGSRGSNEDVTGVGAAGASGEVAARGGHCDSHTNSSSMKSPRGSINSLTKSRGSGGSVGACGGGGTGSRTSPASNHQHHHNHHHPMTTNNLEKDVMSTMNASSCLMDMDIFIAYLKKFATDIISTGLMELVENLMKALLTKYEAVLDHSLLLWTVGFFLSFSQQQELELDQIKEILNLDIFGFLVYEGVKTCESLIVRGRKQEDCTAEKHRLHLVVCTLNQMFRTLLAHNKTKPFPEYLNNLQKYLTRMSDLRNLFVLLIRLHSTALEQGQTYLNDLVQTNHVLMMMLEEWLATGVLAQDQFRMLDHINQFATCKVMAKYGTLLEQEDGNREPLNIAVMTMMYHVAGSCNRHNTLVQLPILKAFTEIWMDNAVREEGKIRAAAKNNLATASLYENEFKDLIEFTLRIFMDNTDKANGSLAERLFANTVSTTSHETSSMESSSMNTDSGLFSKDQGEEEQVLIVAWMAELSGTEDAANIITRRLRDHGYDQNIEQVRKCLEDNDLLMPPRPGAASPNPSSNGGQSEESAAAADSSDQTAKVLQELSMMPEESMIPYLVEKVKDEGHQASLVWMQKQLMEAAYVKLGLQDPSVRIHAEEPVARFYAIQNKSIPLVAWNEELEEALATPYFLLLQKCLGLYTNDDPNILYPRIPQYLTPSHLVDMAMRIGHIEQVPSKFDVTALKEEGLTIGDPQCGGDGDLCLPVPAMERPSRALPEYQWLNAIKSMNQSACFSGS